MSQITTIIFDIGNVLVEQRFEALAKSLSSGEEEYGILMDKVFYGPVWPIIDLGTLGNDEEEAAMIALAPEHERLIRSLYRNIGNCFRTYSYSMDWIREWKRKGYRVYALSNWGRAIYERCGSKLDFLKEMDGVFLSFQYHMVKPNPDYYQLLLDTYKIQPEEAVFLDDVKANVRAAQALGIHGIVFQNKEQAERELAVLGVV